MKFKKLENKYIIRLEKGEDIIEKIIELCKSEGIKLGYFNGLGAVSKIEIGLFEPEGKKYHSNVYDKPMEISSLHGNITEMDGKCYIHCHGVFGDIDNKCFSGHVNKATVGPTCEIILIKMDGTVDRYFDEEIGLNLLKL
jgi:predicted DNA-binding protein with PD1-like motif|tara:strand:- start:46 stop:465 length:420 start_codon:yes stop_codon:yes gene_type:complete